MYTRVPPTNKRPSSSAQIKEPQASIQVPQNYSGVAFSQDGTRIPPTPQNEAVKNEPSPKSRPYTSPTPPPAYSTPGPLGYSDYPWQTEKNADLDTEISAEESSFTDDADDMPDIEATPASLLPMPNKTNQGSLFSSMLSDGMFKSNFPFGHGLGGEELLILGIMLSIYLSGESDGELMLLLGILLFAG